MEELQVVVVVATTEEHLVGHEIARFGLARRVAFPHAPHPELTVVEELSSAVSAIHRRVGVVQVGLIVAVGGIDFRVGEPALDDGAVDIILVLDPIVVVVHSIQPKEQHVIPLVLFVPRITVAGWPPRPVRHHVERSFSAGQGSPRHGQHHAKYEGHDDGGHRYPPRKEI